MVVSRTGIIHPQTTRSPSPLPTRFPKLYLRFVLTSSASAAPNQPKSPADTAPSSVQLCPALSASHPRSPSSIASFPELPRAPIQLSCAHDCLHTTCNPLPRPACDARTARAASYRPTTYTASSHGPARVDAAGDAAASLAHRVLLRLRREQRRRLPSAQPRWLCLSQALHRREYSSFAASHGAAGYLTMHTRTRTELTTAPSRPSSFFFPASQPVLLQLNPSRQTVTARLTP